MLMEIDNPNKDIKMDVKLLKDKLKQFNQINPPSNTYQFTRIHSMKYKNFTKNPDELNSAQTERVPQFATLYHLRLHQVREMIKKQSIQKWTKVNFCENILKLKAKNEEHIIIGLFYKEMALRPSILKGWESILGSKKVSTYVSESDSLFLEDNCGRIKISTNCGFDISGHVTGIIAGLK